MTCIVGIRHYDVVYLGGDSGYGTTAGDGSFTPYIPKVWESGDYLLGMAGSMRLAQILRFGVAWPEVPAATIRDADDALWGFFVTKVAPAISDGLRSVGWDPPNTDDHVGYTWGNGVLLVGVVGRLFEIDHSLTVTPVLLRYGAVGNGADVAKGYLARALCDPEPTESIELLIAQALGAVMQHNNSVREPFTVVKKGRTT